MAVVLCAVLATGLLRGSMGAAPAAVGTSPLPAPPVPLVVTSVPSPPILGVPLVGARNGLYPQLRLGAERVTESPPHGGQERWGPARRECRVGTTSGRPPSFRFRWSLLFLSLFVFLPYALAVAMAWAAMVTRNLETLLGALRSLVARVAPLGIAAAVAEPLLRRRALGPWRRGSLTSSGAIAFLRSWRRSALTLGGLLAAAWPQRCASYRWRWL